MGGYTVTASLAAALDGADGDITVETAPGIIQAMEEADYPGADGLTFQCGGSAVPGRAGGVHERLAAGDARRRRQRRQLRASWTRTSSKGPDRHPPGPAPVAVRSRHRLRAATAGSGLRSATR